MKNFFFICTTLLFTYGAFAQAPIVQVPEKISYQAVVRNVSNNLVSNQAVGMQISILQGSATGTVAYAETQTPTSNANGLVSIEIGGGTAVSGTMATINWASGLYFVKTEIDPVGGTNYTITGTSQLLSVPYALYAKTSGSSTPGPQGATGPIGPVGPAGTNGTNGIGYGGTSASAKTISLGSKTFAVQQGLAYIAGQRIRFVDQTNAANFLEGTITSYSATSMVVNIDNTGGSGTIANWNLTVGGNLGTGVPTGGTAGQVLAKVDGTNFNTAWVTPASGGGSTFPNVELHVVNTTRQTITSRAGGSASTQLNFTGGNNLNALLTGGNTWTGDNTFTVGATGAGWYQISLQITGTSADGTTANNIGILTYIDKNNAIGTTKTGALYRSGFSTYTADTEFKGGSSINVYLYLAAGDNLKFYGVSSSTTVDANTSSNGSTFLSIVRVK